MKNARTPPPPTDNPDLPSFQHPYYNQMQSDLLLVQHLWDDLKNCKAAYIPQEECESDRAYQNRLGRVQFDNRFTPAIRGHAGLLSSFTLAEVSQSIQDAEDNVDFQGNDLTTCSAELDEKVLRDGAAALLVEFPKEDPSIKSNADLIKLQRRPYLVVVDRRNILNWEIGNKNGVPFINQVTIRETRLERVGLFGCEEKTYYRMLVPGGYSVWQLQYIEGNWTKVLIEQGETSLNEVPLIWYAVTEATLFQASLPFINLARLNIEHLQKRSSLNEVLHKCNLPVPVRKGLIKSLAELLKGVAKLVIGPNSVVDIPADGDFYFAEPAGTAIAATQTDIIKLEGSMDRVSLAFLSGGEAQKTATEVVVDSAQTQASLKKMARRKESVCNRAFKIWGEYMGESKPGKLQVNESVLQLPANPQEVQTILDAMGAKIPNKLGLQMLLERKWLPADADLKKIEQQLDQLETEREAQILASNEAIHNEEGELAANKQKAMAA